MMHEREKSDPAVVAVKPVNNAERSAAESVEPRAGAEGNASQHSTGRAQKRATVSQGLERNSKAKDRGEVHHAPAPHQHRSPRTSVPRTQRGRGTGSGRPDMAGL